jgi:hypothetical protein
MWIPNSPNRCPTRHLDDYLGSAFAGLSFALTRHAVLGAYAGGVILLDEVVDIMAGFQHDIAPFTSITTAWTAFWAESFAQQSDTSITAVTGSGVDFDGIDKHGCWMLGFEATSGEGDVLDEKRRGLASPCENLYLGLCCW